MVLPGDFVVDLKDLDIDDQHYVGERAANLGSMVGKFPIPHGFVVAYPAYFEFLKHDNLSTKIKHLLGATNFELTDSVHQIAGHINGIIRSSRFPTNIVNKVTEHYERIGSPRVLIETIMVTGDHGQNLYNRRYKNYETLGDASLLDVIRSSWASIFTPELISHRHKNGFDHFKTAVSVLVTEVLGSATKGRILTADPHSGDKSNTIVQVLSDNGDYLVDKKNLVINRRPKDVSRIELQRLSEAEIVSLAKLGSEIEKHFYFPQVIDWIRDRHSISILDVKKLNFNA